MMLLVFAAALAPRAAAQPIAGEVGRRVGLVKIGANRETGNARFWAAAPLGAEAMDPNNFGIVSASLWNLGGWGGGESVIARRVFETRCPNSENVVVDLGSHVGDDLCGHQSRSYLGGSVRIDAVAATWIVRLVSIHVVAAASTRPDFG